MFKYFLFFNICYDIAIFNKTYKLFIFYFKNNRQNLIRNINTLPNKDLANFGNILKYNDTKMDITLKNSNF